MPSSDEKYRFVHAYAGACNNLDDIVLWCMTNLFSKPNNNLQLQQIDLNTRALLTTTLCSALYTELLKSETFFAHSMLTVMEW